MNLFTENRQTIKTTLLILFFVGFSLSKTLQAQSNKTKIDYSKRSNILNPDTLKGDQKKIFWYFVKLTSEQVEEMKPLDKKEEFALIGITTKNKERFQIAYTFFRASNTAHKSSCEQWELFKDLAPK